MADIDNYLPHGASSVSVGRQRQLEAHLARIRTSAPHARDYMKLLEIHGPCIPGYIGDKFAGVTVGNAPAMVIYNSESQPVSIMLMVRNPQGQYEDLLLPGAELAGCFGRIGHGSDPLVVAETYACGLAIHHATGLSVAVALFAENMLPVVRSLTTRHPERTFIVCGINAATSPDTSGRHQAFEAARAAHAKLAIPTVRSFDEQLAQEGAASVRASIIEADFPSEAPLSLAKDTSGIPAPVAPWPNRVDGTAMMENLLALFGRFLVMSADAKILLALWIIFTHAFGAARIAPLLALLSPVRRCGKTTVLQMLAKLVARPYPSSNITVAALFRTVDKWQPTMLLDEAETYIKNDKDPLTGIINSGHSPQAAYVVRTENNIAIRYSTYCPKFIAAIGTLPVAMRDRSIIIHAVRKRQDEHVDKYPPRSDLLMVAAHAQIVRWVSDHLGEIAKAEPDALNSHNDRTDDNFEIFLKIAECLGGQWPKRTRAAALAFASQDNDTQADGLALLRDIKLAFDAAGKSRLRTLDLIAGICDDVEKPWASYKGRQINAREIATLLAPFGISSKNLCIGDARPKGYERSDFEDPFARYCDATV